MACSGNCQGFYHAFGKGPVEDVHWCQDVNPNNWVACAQQPCPHREFTLPPNDERFSANSAENRDLILRRVSFAALTQALSRAATPAQSRIPTPFAETQVTLPFSTTSSLHSSRRSSFHLSRVVTPSQEEEGDVTIQADMSSAPSGSGSGPTTEQDLDPAQLLQGLLVSVGALNNAVSALLARQDPTSSAPSESRAPRVKTVQRPAPFKGTRGADARRFLAAFTIWAMSLKEDMSIKGINGVWVPNHELWIRSALSFMEDNAAIWATPYMEQCGTTALPFGNNWDTFRATFKLRFESVDESVDAKETLWALWQGKQTVAEYAAKFKEVMGRTGYSEADLHDRFYKHLSTEVKDALVHTEKPIATLAQLEAVAVQVDNRIRHRKAERAREQGRTLPKSFNPGYTSAPVTPFTPAKDPNAMEIDATRTGPNGRTTADFLKAMNGRCFGCGSASHQKKDGKHERDVCGYCRRVGHRESVCQNKWMGYSRPEAVKAGSTSGVEEIFEMNPSSTAPSAPAKPAASEVSQIGTSSSGAAIAANITADPAIQKILERQKELEAELSALRKAF